MLKVGALRPRAGCGRGTLSTSETNLDLLRAAIGRRAGVVLSLPVTAQSGSRTGADAGTAGPDAGPLCHYKSRFLADGGDGLWVASVPAEPALLQRLVDRRAMAGVSFRSGHVKVMFAAPVLHVQADYATAGGAPTAAILLRFPEAGEVRAVQRRRNYRVPLLPAGDFAVRLWTMADDATLRDKPSNRSELRCEPFDVSVAGLGVVFPGVEGHALATRAGARLRVQLTFRDAAVVLEGRLCYAPRSMPDRPGLFRGGIQFKVLSDGKDDRAAKVTLDRIVSDLQRDSIRRRKLSGA